MIENTNFFISDPLGSKLLTHLWLNFSHLSECKFKRNFAGNVNPIHSCGARNGATDHYILRSLQKRWTFPLRISLVYELFSLLKKSVMENFIFCAVVAKILFLFLRISTIYDVPHFFQIYNHLMFNGPFFLITVINSKKHDASSF